MFRASVPCSGCTLCCEQDAVFLHPEHGDDPRFYETVEAIHPLTGERRLMLARGADGRSCVYLEKGVGCRVYDRQPAMCREFDCRRFAQRFDALPRPERRRLKAQGVTDPAVLERGRALIAQHSGIKAEDDAESKNG